MTENKDIDRVTEAFNEARAEYKINEERESSRSIESLRSVVQLPREAPEVLIPFTTQLRGNAQYRMDFSGRIWLISGFNQMHVSDSLSEFLHRVLI